jgi:hypothetical protein
VVPVGLCFGFIVIQLVPVNRTNPPVQGDFRGSTAVVSVLRRACYDYHSNETRWPWYSRLAPMSWIIAHDVNEARLSANGQSVLRGWSGSTGRGEDGENDDD